MKKEHAWTLIELIVAATIIFIISYTLLNTVKPNKQRTALYIDAAATNIMRGNIGILENYETNETEGGLFYQKSGDSTNNTYCMQLANMFSLESTPNCATPSSDDTVNIALGNGAEIKGLAKDAQTPYDGANYQYKNIFVDIDGFNQKVNIAAV